MQFGIWDTLFNLLLLVFWFRIWMDDDRDVFFNPYLAPLGRFSDSAINFLRPVFFGLSTRVIAASSMLVLMVLRGVAAPKGHGWILRIGFEIRQPDNPVFLSALIFSVVSFGIFLFKLWGLCMIYVLSGTGRPSAHNTAALYHLAKPFSRIRREYRPLVLLVCGLAIAVLLNVFGAHPPASVARNEFGLPPQVLYVAENQALAVGAARMLISFFAAVVGLIGIVLQLIFVLIIGSWISLFTGAQGLAFFCREWMNMLLGPLSRRPIRLGMLDLSPLIFIIVAGAAQWILTSILLQSYFRLL